MNRQIQNFQEIISNYDCVLCDLWGVIIDGYSLYEHAYDCLKHIIKNKKTLIFISNSSLPQHMLHDKLHDAGITDEVILQNIVSSGDVVRDLILHPAKCTDFNATGKYFMFGKFSLFDNMSDLYLTNDINEAEYIIIGNTNAENNEVQLLLEYGLPRKLPVVCINPDKSTVAGGKIKRCAGFMADLYEEQGGTVFYYGKPYKRIYEYVYEKYQINSKEKRIICVGDMLYTDILGATTMHLDSLLVTNGMFKHDHEHEIQIEDVFKKQNIFPTYYIDKFK